MQNPKAISLIGWLLPLLLMVSCASLQAPSTLPTAREVPESPRGAWIKVETESGKEISGELISVSEKGVFIESESEGNLYVIGWGEVKRARLVRYRPGGWWGLIVWTVVGTASTASHGWALILTAPAWLVLGTISTVIATREPVSECSDDFRKCIPFSRYPQGMPVELEQKAIRYR
jgi:hypothetical protein